MNIKFVKCRLFGKSNGQNGMFIGANNFVQLAILAPIHWPLKHRTPMTYIYTVCTGSNFSSCGNVTWYRYCGDWLVVVTWYKSCVVIGYQLLSQGIVLNIKSWLTRPLDIVVCTVWWLVGVCHVLQILCGDWLVCVTCYVQCSFVVVDL